MQIKQLIDEDFVNYRKPSMYIAFPRCTWKCETEFGSVFCQNKRIANQKNIDVRIDDIITRYTDNILTESIVISGLEPFDDFEQLYEFIFKLRKVCNDDVVIYSGYYLEEVRSYIERLSVFNNIIVKFGRYIPNRAKRFDSILGVMLASDNQYAEVISK